jgi:vitamin B12 transporter
MTAGTGRNDTYYMNNSYVVWDANISYDMNKDMTLYAAVNNLTNEGYDLYHNYPMSGRYWQAGVKYTF